MEFRPFDSFLTAYRERDFILQLKAKILLIICLVLLVVGLPFLLSNLLIRKIHDLSLLGPTALVLILTISSMYLIKNGYFHQASKIILGMLFVCIWTVMFVYEEPNPVARVDTIVIVLALMTLCPLVVGRRTIITYGVLNLIAFIFFVKFVVIGKLDLPEGAFVDYLSDTLISLMFVVVIGFLVYHVNSKALNRSEAFQRELQELNQNLEVKIAERTCELEVAMRDLKSINEQLSAARDALWGEMELAKKVQSVLLPEDPKIRGYEISVHMIPATEVGGDYYDIIHVGGMDWIIIGDVSGHGVPAGLIMMMVQTSINVTLIQNPELKPAELLHIVNQTITSNMKRLGEDRYMTITVLAVHQGGRFTFSGLHQDIMIYRRQTSSVETVETEGLWLGLVDDISSAIKNDKFALIPGDSMLIYTDGLIEAKKVSAAPAPQGTEVELFGQERLQEVYQRLGDQPPEKIKRGILESLCGYVSDDDVTMVILRRMPDASLPAPAIA